eukprot:scaffold14195_cov155-Skeletonema_dohrnii-CCMP3373.AAC.12
MAEVIINYARSHDIGEEMLLLLAWATNPYSLHAHAFPSFIVAQVVTTRSFIQDVSYLSTINQEHAKIQEHSSEMDVPVLSTSTCLSRHCVLLLIIPFPFFLSFQDAALGYGVEDLYPLQSSGKELFS